MDAQCCKVWSKKHGYGSDNSDLDEDEIKQKGQKKCMTVGKCKCRLTTHQCTTHSECHLNLKSGISSRKRRESGNSVNDRASEDGDVITPKVHRCRKHCFKESVLTPTGDSSWCFEDDM